MEFSYVAVNEKNRKYRNRMTANTKEEVKRKLEQRGLIAISINEVKKGSQDDIPIWQRDLGGTKDVHTLKISNKRLLTFMHQMALMIRSGISLSVAMAVMCDTEKDKNMLRILQEITSNLYNGITLSQSLSSFKTFPTVYVNIIQTGEANGRLDEAFDKCVSLLKKEITLKNKIKGAMIYPIFLLILTIALIIVMSIVVLPAFKDLFESFGSELPIMTQITMGISDVLLHFGWLVVLIIVAIVVTLRILYKKNYSFCMWWSTFQLKIPIIGEVLRLNQLTRFANMMATLTSSGVNILYSLELSRDVVGNKFMSDCLNQVIEDVRIGTPINVSLSRYPKAFDPLFVSMIRVGEESGMLSDSLNKMADMYDEQATDATQRMTDAMTPAMTIIIAGIVGFVVISIVQAMFGMYSVITTT
ncbi:MAG: type II secretion system F family protein [Ruminococcus sp.]|uniref:type II secretion system F family protein n=1 Tax=Ruminococcus sp. TaxID=41978 RepID=UPI00260037BC|nr:type II secretion system F family protein [Ruminococcus sp.]MBD9049139.1 type II secretion system F family protein [Ruminococcus sp.]